MNELQLIARAQQGDPLAFEALVKCHESFVYNLALRVLKDPLEAEDIAQQAFVRAWRALPGFRAEAKFRTWLYRIVTNLCYNRLPSLKKELSLIEPAEDVLPPDECQEVEARILSEEMRIRLHEAIAGLPESYRLLLTLRHLQDMSYTEIAQVTNQPLGTVKTGIFRARKMLKEILIQQEVKVG